LHIPISEIAMCEADLRIEAVYKIDINIRLQATLGWQVRKSGFTQQIQILRAVMFRGRERKGEGELE